MSLNVMNPAQAGAAILLLLLSCGGLSAQTSAKKPREPDLWGVRLETAASAGFFKSGDRIGVGTNHRATLQGCWTPVRFCRGSLALFGLDATLDAAAVEHRDHGRRLFHWSVSTIHGFGFFLPEAASRPCYTWRRFSMHANLIVGSAGIRDTETGGPQMAMRVGGEFVISQIPFSSNGRHVFSVNVRYGGVGEIFLNDRASRKVFADAWYTLGLYPVNLICGVVFSYRFIGTGREHNHFFSLGVSIYV